jgi:hypothetical protein
VGSTSHLQNAILQTIRALASIIICAINMYSVISVNVMTIGRCSNCILMLIEYVYDSAA